MYSFSAFHLYDYLILIGLLIVALIVLLLLLKRIRKNNINFINIFSIRNNSIIISIGILLSILSIIGYTLIEKSHTGFFNFLSAQVKVPLVLLSIFGLLLGIIYIIIGSYKIRLIRKSKK
jgi:hypothetical protein